MTEQLANAEFGSHYVPGLFGHFNKIIPLHFQHVNEIKYFITTLSFFSPLGSKRRHSVHLLKKKKKNQQQNNNKNLI